MKLAYTIPGKLWWIHNFLEYEDYKGIHNAIIKERKNINLKSVKGLWGKNLYENIKTMPERVGVKKYPPFDTLKTLIRTNKILSLPPIGNSLVFVKSPLEHKVNTVLSPLLPRITVQLFMK